MMLEDSAARDKVPVLLVDDTPANLLALEAILPDAEYELVKVTSGPDAVREVGSRDFAVVLLDVLMPGVDGFETARQLKALARGERCIPVIFVTAAECDPMEVLRAYADGAVDYIQKPLHPHVLRAKVAVFAELFRARQRLLLEKRRAVDDAVALDRAVQARDRDVARRRAAEEQLHVSEERYRHLVDAITDYAIFVLDANGHVATWNAGAQKTKGYESEEIIGKHFSVFYTPEDRAADKPAKVLDTVRREGLFEEEGWRVRKDGTRFWASVVVTSLRNQRGELIGFAKVVRDLTGIRAAAESERRLADEQLARAVSETERRRLLALLGQVPAAITVLRGPDLVFEFANAKAMETMRDPEVLDKPFLDVWPEKEEPLAYSRLLGVYERGEPFAQHEALAWREVQGKRVQTYWNSVYLPVRDPSGAIEGVMTFDFDVTESVLARQELERVSRANQLAREELEALNCAKDDFLAMVSHELRSPLTAICGWASILRKSSLDPKRLERGLEVIERNARAQTRLVSDLLDVSRMISGKLRLHLRKTSVCPLIHDAADVVRPAADAKGVQVFLDLDPEVGSTMADPDRLRQVMWNLLTNAVRFTPRGGRITIRANRTDSGIVVRVQDTGSGIAPEHLPHLFERFTQVDSSTTRAHGGLGLGLAIVRHLVEAHGGVVLAYSDGPGRGTTLTFTLPVPAVALASSEDEILAGPDEAARTVDSPPTVSLEQVRVLVVDDDVDSLDVLRIVLEGAGAKVTTATSAREALAVGGAFELIISDIGMPEMDGYTFISRVRSRADSAHVPAIALTAYARAEDAERAKCAGYQEHLAKPVDEGQLLQAVRTWSHAVGP